MPPSLPPRQPKNKFVYKIFCYNCLLGEPTVNDVGEAKSALKVFGEFIGDGELLAGMEVFIRGTLAFLNIIKLK